MIFGTLVAGAASTKLFNNEYSCKFFSRVRIQVRFEIAIVRLIVAIEIAVVKYSF
jgi:hypothetical protein